MIIVFGMSPLGITANAIKYYFYIKKISFEFSRADCLKHAENNDFLETKSASKPTIKVPVV